MIRRLLGLLVGVGFCAAAPAVNIYFGNFSQTGTNPGVGLGLAAVDGSASTFAAQVLLYEDSLASPTAIVKAFCYTPNLVVYLPSGPKEYAKTEHIVKAGDVLSQLDVYGWLAGRYQNDDVHAAGLQLDIWKKAGDTGFGARTPTTAQQWSDAIAYRDLLDGAAPAVGATLSYAFSYWDYVPTDGTLQSFVSPGGTPPDTLSVPEPFTLGLGVAFLGMALGARLRLRKQ